MTAKLSKDQIKQEIALIKSGAKPPIEDEAIIGENRKQLFVRIPKSVSNRLELKKGNTIIFKIYTKDGKDHLEFEVKNATR